MHFSYIRIDDLPPLAWVATWLPDSEEIVAKHGGFVDTHPDFFIEGAWAGDFAEGQIQDADTVFGSGGVLTGDSVIFVSCTATTDYLYHNDRTDPFVISNSLPLLLATLGDALDPANTAYGNINMSVREGIHLFTSHIPTRNGHVRRVMHHNVRPDSSAVALIEKPHAPDFSSFLEYRDYLRLRIGQLFANARHDARHRPLKVYTTQSRGYDSTAVNALAAPFGIDRAFTCPESKEKQSYYLGKRSQEPSDDGGEICSMLGVPCTSIDRLSFEKSPLTDERYYWAGLDNNVDFNMREVANHIDAPALLLTGQYGEFWYPSSIVGKHRMHFIDDGLKKWDHAGHGLAEVRLITGFVQAAIPVIGSRRRAAILRISDDEEMTPWRIGTSYDRPIPRRIAEDAGVPRNMFGQIKLAAVVHLPTPNVPITSSLRADFFRHLKQHHLDGPAGVWLLPYAQRLNNWIHWNDPGSYFSDREKHPALWFLGRIWFRVFGKAPAVRMVWPRIDSYLYAFCVNKVRDEYAQHLERVGPRAPDVDASS